MGDLPITGATRVAALIGAPVRHSLSPTILNAGFAARGLDWVFVVHEVPPGQGEAALAAVRTLGLSGLSVTMPHKAAACAAVDERTPVAQALGAVNCVFWSDGGDRLVGDNTDGAGFLDALRLDEGIDPAGQACVVVGAGGAGRAVVRALGEAGAAEVVVVNRSPGPAEHAAELAGAEGRVGVADDVTKAAIVVNATPLGMADTAGGAPALPFDPDLLRPGQVVVDLIYHPLTTPLLAEARRRDLTAVNGLGMLVHQAAHAFRRWTGDDAPVAAMADAAAAALGRRI
ncbi:MAG TPA: shikimate dehydrogenase [Acidimicrobiales bacterium]|nr:shikimate dehydrogenase [Acidimicrobiales bacterium]